MGNLVLSQARTITTQGQQIDSLKHQPAWVKRQVHLGEAFPVPAVAPETRKAVPFFDESRVPVETIMVMSTEMQQLKPEQFEIIGQKVSFRLAQRPSSTVVLKHVRPLIKILKTQSILCAPAPVGVLEKAAAPM